MKISDQIGLAVTNLSRRKGRTALTVVGVVVGICAVIVMISMGIAESHNNDEMLKNMGGLTKIEVYNYGSQNINGQESSWIMKPSSSSARSTMLRPLPPITSRT